MVRFMFSKITLAAVEGGNGGRIEARNPFFGG